MFQRQIQDPPAQDETLSGVPPQTVGSLGAGGFIVSIALDTVAPYVAYQLLTARTVPTLTALSLTTIFPIAGILLSLARTRHADVIGIASLIVILLGLASSLIFQSAGLFLIKDSFISGTLALICLISLFVFPRPAMFYVGRSLLSHGNANAMRNYDALWQYAYFRFTQRLVTVVWGVAYVIEALIRVVLIIIFGTSKQGVATILLVSPFLLWGVTIVALGWTFWYIRYASRKGDRMLADDDLADDPVNNSASVPTR